MLKICTELERPEFFFVSDYREDLSSKYVSPGRHRKTTCFSEINRYPQQTKHVKNLMIENKNTPINMLNIGVAQGQEPLTHINSAFELAKTTGKTIPDFLDITTVDILKSPPSLPPQATKMPKEVLSHLDKVYSSTSGKSFWGTPAEDIVEKMLKTGKKQDVVLFNNVIQHLSPKNEPALFKFFEKLTDLVAPKGSFCFSCERHAIFKGPLPFERVKQMLKILKNKNFIKIASGIFMRRI